ncbi:MAG: cytochrome c biogenesis CcdA family protein [Acidimicrobiales bacterium]
MTSDVGYLAAFAGGVVSFLSPCVLPIVPAYLAIITGLDVEQLRDADRPLARITRDTVLFVAGFSSVFIALGLSLTTVGQTLFHNQSLLTRVSGGVVLVMALFLLGSLFLNAPWLYQERRFHPRLSRFGPFAAPVAGVAFGFGWTPCIGPVLTSILAVAASRNSGGEGAALLAAYSLGLGVPFLATGLAFGRLAGVLGWAKRHVHELTAASSFALAAFGVLLVTDRLVWLTGELQQALDAVGLGRLVELG